MNNNTLRFGALSTVKKYDYWFIFLLSYFYIHWSLLWSGSGFVVLIFTVLFCTLFTLRLSADGPIDEERQKAARPWLLVVFLSALACSWFDYSMLIWCNFLFLTAAAVYWAMTLSGKRILPAISNYLPLDLFTGLLSVPFANFGRLFGAIFRTKAHRQVVDAEPIPRSHSQLLHNLLLIGGTLFLLGPLLLIVLNLLAAADEGFMRMIARMIDGFFGFFDDVISFRMVEFTWELCLTIPVACYLFGLLWACSRPDHAKGWKSKDRVDHMVSSLRFVPRIMIYTGLGLFGGIYLLFLGLQAGHLISAMGGTLPDSTTYSAFARQGFFELCAVAFINLMIMAGAWILSSRRLEGDAEGVPRALRLILAFLSFETILLVITAMTKMALYIQVYGLTRLRIYTFWFMIWLLVAFAILMFHHLIGNCSAAFSSRRSPANLLTILSIVMFLALCYLNPDAWIVRENLDRYDHGQMSLEELDLYGLLNQSDDSALAILDYYEEHLSDTSSVGRDPLLNQIKRWIDHVEPELRFDYTFSHRTVSSLRLSRRLETLKSL